MSPRRLAALVAAATLAAGCASDVAEDEPIQPVDALTWETDVDAELDGVPLAVGSASQPVDELLGWIAVESLVAAGADVTDDLAVGDTQATREAQLAGLIDLYWETTGTGWLALLREIGPSDDPDQLYQDVRDEDLEENGILWLPPAPADAGVGVVGSPEVMEDLGISTLSELAAELAETQEGALVCVSSRDEPLDPAGLGALAEAADSRIRPRLINPVPPGRADRPRRGRHVLPVRPGRPARPGAGRGRPRAPGGRPRRLRGRAARGDDPGGHPRHRNRASTTSSSRSAPPSTPTPSGCCSGGSPSTTRTLGTWPGTGWWRRASPRPDALGGEPPVGAWAPVRFPSWLPSTSYANTWTPACPTPR